MKPRTSLVLAAALFLGACSSPVESASTFEDSTTRGSSATPEPITAKSPTEPAPKAPAESAEPCAFGTRTAAGCEVTYAIDVEAAAAALPKTCDGGTAYNDCSGEPVTLSWKDIGDHVPRSAHVELGIAMFCADPLIDATVPQRQGVSVNGGIAYAFDGDVSACSCNAVTTAHAFDVSAAALASYRAGGDNTVTVQGPNRCLGVGALPGSGAVARIVVTY